MSKDDATGLISPEEAAALAAALFEDAPAFDAAKMVLRLLADAGRLRRRGRPWAAVNQERLAEALLAELRRRAS
jgi:hypothetical protein